MPPPPAGTGTRGDSFQPPVRCRVRQGRQLYIADGMGNNNRIAKFGPDGNFIDSWGNTGSGTGSSTGFGVSPSTPRATSTSPTPATPGYRFSIPVASSSPEITGIGSPMAICITGGSPQYLYSSNSNDLERLDNGEIYKISLDGKIVGQFGRAGRLAREFNSVNSLDCRTDNNLLVAEVASWRVQKVTIKPR